MIREVLVDELRGREVELTQARGQAAGLQGEVHQATGQLATTEQRLQEMQSALQQEEDRGEKLQAELNALRAAVEDSGRIAEAKAEAANIARKWIVVPVAAIIAASVLLGVVERLYSKPHPLA